MRRNVFINDSDHESLFNFKKNDPIERPTYDDYQGSYAQDVEGWSDQDINDVFDGDPDMYWNID